MIMMMMVMMMMMMMMMKLRAKDPKAVLRDVGCIDTVLKGECWQNA